MNVLDLSRLPGVLRTHWLWVLGAPVGLALMILAAYQVLAPSYRASAEVIIDGRGVDRLVDTQRDANPTPASQISTAMDVMRSDPVLARALESLGLTGAAPTGAAAVALATERRLAWRKATQEAMPYEAWLVRWLGKALTVQPAGLNSNVVVVQIDFSSPDKAALLANAVAQAYLQVALDISLAPTRQTATFYEAQIQQARLALSEAQAERSRFQQANGLTSVSEANDLESALMAEMAAAATLARAKGAEAAARSGAARSSPQLSPEAVQSGAVQQAQTDLSRARGQLAELSSRLGSQHPQVQAQQQQITELEQRLHDLSNTVARSVAVGAQAATSSDRAVQDLLQQQRDRVLTLKKAREELAVLQQNVDAAQRAYEQAQQRHAQATARNDSMLSDARLLAPASVPLDANRPPLLLAMIFALLAGLLAGVAGALIAEQRRPLVRLPSDLSDVLALPVLAQVPHLQISNKPSARETAFSPWARLRSAR